MAAPAVALAIASPVHAQTAAADPRPADSKAPPTTVQGLTVTAAPQQQAVRTEIDRKSYSVSSDLQATNGSIGDALRNVPSVEVDVQGNVSLRGDANVTIMIDGKPSGMFKGAGRANALQQLPAERVDRVEVITNPSAAFDPDGSAGIINLITKKGKGAGASGAVRASYGEFGRRNGGISGTYNARNLALNGDIALRHDVQKTAITDQRTTTDPTTGASLDSVNTSHGRGAPDIFTAHGTLDYDLDKTSRLSLELDHNHVDYTAKPLETFESGLSGGPLSLLSLRQGAIHFHNLNNEIGGTYRKTFAGEDHSFTLNLDYDATLNHSSRPFTYAVGAPAPGMPFEDYRMRTEQDRSQVKAEYKRPLPGGAKLTAGYQFQYDDNAYDNLDLRGATPGSAAEVPALTDHFRYEQSVQSLYATYQRPFGELTVLAGLRLEDVRRHTDQLVLRQSDTVDYLRAYPSLHLAWDLGGGQQLTAAYSRRVQRPQPQDLNAYRYYQDVFTYRAGNPRLQPQVTDSYELGYQYRKGPTSYLATLFYRDNRDAVTDVIRDLGGGVLLTTKENAGAYRSSGLELVATGKLLPTLSYNVSSSLFWSEIDAAGLGFAKDRSGTSLQGRGNLNWQVTPIDFLQANVIANGRRLLPQGYRDGFTSVNFGYRRKFDERVSMTVTVQDAFQGFRFRSRVDTPQLRQTLVQEPRFRGVYIGLTYILGDVKRARKDQGFDFGGGGAPTP